MQPLSRLSLFDLMMFFVGEIYIYIYKYVLCVLVVVFALQKAFVFWCNKCFFYLSSHNLIIDFCILC